MSGEVDGPTVNLLDDSIRLSLALSRDADILHDPLDDVVLEGPFDQLMEQIR